MYTTVYLGNLLDLLQYLNLGTVVATCTACTSRESFTAVVHVIIIGRIPAIAACFEFGPAATYLGTDTKILSLHEVSDPKTQ